MAIIKQYHKDTNTTYVYESTSYWDPEKGQSRSKRKLLGKLDPETGEIVATGKTGRPKKKISSQPESIDASKADDLGLKLAAAEQEITALRARVIELEAHNKKLEAGLKKIGSHIVQASEAFSMVNS